MGFQILHFWHKEEEEGKKQKGVPLPWLDESVFCSLPESPPSAFSLISLTTQGKLGHEGVYLGILPAGGGGRFLGVKVK